MALENLNPELVGVSQGNINGSRKPKSWAGWGESRQYK